MFKRTLMVCLALMLAFTFVAICAPGALADPEVIMTVKSKSVKDGKLLTACAANNKQNSPKGGGKSPQLSWTKVPGAKYYAVLMYDVTENWNHWLVKSISAKKTSLKLGAYKKSNGYIGPYPPSGTGRHTYRIHVFALKAKPDAFKYKNNIAGDVSATFLALNTRKGVMGNIIASNYIEATYEHGDKTK